MEKTNSPLISGTLLTNNCSKPRNQEVTRITPHCFVGQVTGRRGCEVFLPAKKRASCNYVIGKDGEIWLNVEEKNRAWTTSSAHNDNRAITFEIASDTSHPYAITAAAYESMIALMTDICQRYDKKRIVWIADKTRALKYAKKQPSDEMLITVHRWYANKSCPGEYIHSRLKEVVEQVNARLGASSKPAPSPFLPYLARVKINDLNIRSGPGTDHSINAICPPGVYTITAESTGKGATKWGRLKSGAGWISLDYATKI